MDGGTPDTSVTSESPRDGDPTQESESTPDGGEDQSSLGDF
jgi:hypothetical protein